MRAAEVVFYCDEGQWMAQALNVDVSSFGYTRDETREAIREALELYFEDGESIDVHETADVHIERPQVA